MLLARECVGPRQLVCEAMGQTCTVGGGCILIERRELPEFPGNAEDSGVMPMDATTPMDATVPMDVAIPPVDAIAFDGSMFGMCPVAMPVAATGGEIAPRLIAPISGGVLTRRRPTFRWSLPAGVTGARLELCTDPRRATIASAFDATGSSFTVPCDLPPGVLFFRVRANNAGVFGSATSAVWQARVPPTSTPADGVDGIDRDFNGDGIADLAYASGTEVILVEGVRGTIPREAATPIATRSVAASSTRDLGSSRCASSRARFVTSRAQARTSSRCASGRQEPSSFRSTWGARFRARWLRRFPRRAG
jgi:hypothetical protein